MAVRHEPTGEVHKRYKGGTTSCGFNINEHPSHWTNTTTMIACAKTGCNN